jgi:hypothetical protein
VWKATLGERTLHFELAGINNQNFIMRDRETGTWWQQVSGRAIHGPLAGRSLESMPWDEVSFSLFRDEHPAAGVLLPSDEHAADYASADWEEEIAGYPTVGEADPDAPLAPRDLVVGIAVDGAARAYRWTDLDPARPVADRVGGTPILLVLHPDGLSLRCFDRRLDGRTLEIFLQPASDPPVLLDAATGSAWDFSGRATSGSMCGRQLGRIACLKDYWFDWNVYHPECESKEPEGQSASRCVPH